MTVLVGFVKLGNIGSAPLLEFLLDERAEREDIDVRVVTSGAKLGLKQAEEVAKKLLEFNPQLVIVTSPNASLPGPTRVRQIMHENDKPCITVSDSPAKGVINEIKKLGQGYIIVEADSMLGARREFLDPNEMALFNVDVIKVLAVTGTFNVLFTEIDRVIDAIKAGKEIKLPQVVINRDVAIKNSGLRNPYAIAKAMAAYEIAKAVSPLTVEACFKLKDWEKYTQLNAAAHEMMREAAVLADQAREIEKYSDTLQRTPHYDDGTILRKVALIEKPVKEGIKPSPKEISNKLPEKAIGMVSDKLTSLLLLSKVKISPILAKELLADLRANKVATRQGIEHLLQALIPEESEKVALVFKELGLLDVASLIER
jgi:methylenetetrahydromethanopterin dehydrogenase